MTGRIRRRNILWWFLALLLAGFVALNVLARNHARKMLCYAEEGRRTAAPEALSFWGKARVLIAGVNLPRPRGRLTPGDAGLEYESVVISNGPSIRLGAWFCPASKQPAPLAILFHGYGAEKSAMLEEAKAFHELGFSALLVDFRGSGESSESCTTIGFVEAEDVRAAMAYAKDSIPADFVLLFGQSMGAAAILRAIHAEGVRPDAIVLEAVFDDMLQTIRNRFGSMGVPSFPAAELLLFWGSRHAGFNAFIHNPVDYARSVECPALFLHGTDDPRARLAEARRVYDATPVKEKWFVEFPRTVHENYVGRFPDEWRQAVRQLVPP